jgi:hypothetical protein
MNDAPSIDHRLAELQAAVAALQRERDDAGYEYTEVAQNVIPAHLQSERILATERKRIVAKYRDGGLPKVLRDENGLAAKAITDATDKKWLLTELPKFQKNALDLAKIAAHGISEADRQQDASKQAQLLGEALRDALVIALDNAQLVAHLQIKGVFKAADAEGAITFVKPNAADGNFDPDDANVVQHDHVEAIAAYRKMASALPAKRTSKQGSRPNGFSSGKGGGRNRGRPKGGKGWQNQNRDGRNWRSGGSWSNQNQNKNDKNRHDQQSDDS